MNKRGMIHAVCMLALSALLCFGRNDPLLAGEPYITASALFEGRAMLTIEGRPQLLRVGESSPEGVKLLSANASEAVVEYAGKRRTLQPGRHTGGGFAEPERLQVAIARNGRNEYLVQGSVNGRQAQFLVDTGANVIAMSGADARRLGIAYGGKGDEPGHVQTASGVVEAWPVMLDRVEISGIVVRHVQATVIEGSYPQKVLLGMSWIGRVSMREDSGVLYLQQK
jgi:aspartyl protease family protein